MRHRWQVLVTTLVVSVIAGFMARGLRLDSNMLALLPDDRPSVTSLHEVLDKVGGAGDLIVMVESPNPESSLRYAESLLPAVRARPWVEEARIGEDTSFFDAHKLLYVDLADLQTIQERIQRRLDYEKLQAQPFYIDLEDAPPPSLDFSDIEDKYLEEGPRSPYFRNEDGTILLMVIQPRGTSSDLEFGRRIYRDLRELVDATEPGKFHPEMRVDVGGTFRNRIEEVRTIIDDVTSSSVVVALAILLLITLYFRHPLAALLVMVPLAMSLSWTFAMAYWLIGTLNLVTVFLVVVLMGLGIDFGIHMLARYQNERADGRDLETAMSQMLARAGRASLVAGLTTAGCFFALLATDFRGFVEFGIIAGTGLILSAISFFLVLPALLSVVVDRGWMKPPSRPPRAPAAGTMGVPRVALALCLLFLGAALWVGRGASFEYDLRNLRAKHPTTREFNRKMREVFPAARDPAAILVPDSETATKIAQELESRRAEKGDRSPIEKVVSMGDLLPAEQDAKLRILHALREQVDEMFGILDDEEREELEPLRADLDVERVDGVDALPADVRRKFVGAPNTPGQLVYVYQAGSLLDLRVAQRFAEAVGDLEVDGQTYRAISEPLVYVDMLRLLKRDTPIALLLSTIALLGLLLIDFRSPGRVLIAIVPLASGLVLMVGYMALFSLRLNLLNVVVLPSMLGLGVDGGVHIFHSIREHGRDQMWRVLRETGTAVATCTVTSMLGFAGLLVADHPGLRSIGALALVGLAGCLLGAVVVLPILVANLPGVDRE